MQYFFSDTFEPRELPKRPTSAPAGSATKIAVLAERYERGVLLYHPDDNPQVLRGHGATGSIQKAVDVASDAARREERRMTFAGNGSRLNGIAIVKRGD